MLCNNIDMKDPEEANIILSIKISRLEKGISFDQYHYDDKILKKYNYFDCKPNFFFSHQYFTCIYIVCVCVGGWVGVGAKN